MKLIEQYVDFLGGFLKIDHPIRVVFDASDGTAGPILNRLFQGKQIVASELINGEPNGSFPAHGPDFLSPGAADKLSEVIIEQKADFGAIFDGDGDRVMFLDENGQIINPYSAFLCLKDFFNPPYVLDARALADFTMPGVNVIEERVGRYHLIRRMKKDNLSFGAEFSGHYYFKDFFYCDAGILTAVFMMNLVAQLKGSGQSLSKRVDKVTGFRWAPEVNFEIVDKEGALRRIEEYYAQDKSAKMNKLDGISFVGSDFAFNIRPSNTEDLVRLTMVAKDKRILHDKLSEIRTVVEGN